MAQCPSPDSKLCNHNFLRRITIYLLDMNAQKVRHCTVRKLLLSVAIGTAFVIFFCSRMFAQQFVDVSSQVGLVMEAKKSKGNPVWGDFNNDGVLDLIVPCHGLSLSHGPFVYLGNANGTFTDIRATCGFSNLRQFDDYDRTDWHGFSLGDYDADGN